MPSQYIGHAALIFCHFAAEHATEWLIVVVMVAAEQQLTLAAETIAESC